MIKSLLISLFIIITLCAPAQAERRMIIDFPEFYPFVSRDEQGNMRGFFHDIVEQALHELGVEAQWQSFPWGRCQSNVQEDAADAIITAPTPQRLTYTKTHATPIFEKQLHIFTRAGHERMHEIKSITCISDIEELDLTVVTYVGNGWNREHIRKMGIRTYQTRQIKGIWQMLANSRGDIVIEWPGGSWPDIRTQGLCNKIVDTGVVVGVMPFHLLVGTNSRFVSILPRFDKIIKRMQTDGTIESIIAKYHDFDGCR